MSVLSSLVLAALPFGAPILAAAPAPAEAAPTAEHAEQQTEQDDAAKRRSKGLVLRGFATAGTVSLPGVGVGGGLSVGYLRNRFRVDVMGSGRLNRSTWYPQTMMGGTVGGDFALWRAGLRACWVGGSGKVSTPVCGGADSGMVTASGVGIDSARTERVPWASVFADIDLAWHVLPQVALVTTSRWLVPLVRREFYVGDRGTLVTTAPFGVEIGLGLELVLP